MLIMSRGGCQTADEPEVKNTGLYTLLAAKCEKADYLTSNIF
jgi:hypothetical protein